MLQIIIATMLFLVMAFGIGFVINMLVKTTWFPTYFIIAIIIVLAVWAPWGGNNEKLIDVISNYTIIDFIPVIGAIAGALLSGTSMKALRKAGFKMF
ncbi:MAG TPA: YuiB family protein [Candidatus Paenibacillus intestinavium]|nr:YuiB family protein [Candidatus Paenibacillus intestinavium]